MQTRAKYPPDPGMPVPVPEVLVVEVQLPVLVVEPAPAAAEDQGAVVAVRWEAVEGQEPGE